MQRNGSAVNQKTTYFQGKFSTTGSNSNLAEIKINSNLAEIKINSNLAKIEIKLIRFVTESCDSGYDYNSSEGISILCNRELNLERDSYYAPDVPPSCDDHCQIQNARKGVNCQWRRDGVINGSESCDEGKNNGESGRCKSDCSGMDLP